MLGPLIGADLLHLRDIAALESGIAGIGGVGTFNGIVLSGIVAAYFANQYELTSLQSLFSTDTRCSHDAFYLSITEHSPSLVSSLYLC